MTSRFINYTISKPPAEDVHHRKPDLHPERFKTLQIRAQERRICCMYRSIIGMIAIFLGIWRASGLDPVAWIKCDLDNHGIPRAGYNRPISTGDSKLDTTRGLRRRFLSLSMWHPVRTKISVYRSQPFISISSRYTKRWHIDQGLRLLVRAVWHLWLVVGRFWVLK